jgi:hypothetical protein
MNKHTPTPWGFIYDGSSEWSIGPADDPQSNPVMTIWSKDDDKARANAAHIVKCVNEREELVEALSILLKEYRQFLWDEFSTKDDEYSRRAKKALARAEKEP